MIKNVIKNYLVASLALCPLFAFAVEEAGPRFKIQKACRDGDSVRAKMTVVLDNVKLKGQTLLMLTPTLTANKGEKTYAFRPVYVGRHNALVQYRRQAKKVNGGVKPLAVVHRNNGKPQQIEVMLSAPYSNWMSDAALQVDEKTRGCAGCDLGEADYDIARNFFGEPYTPNYQLAYIEPKAEVNKVRNETFAAHFAFIVSNSTLMRDYRNNKPELDRVDSITNSILQNKDLKVSDISIDGYASPEGYEKANLDLSRNRAQALVNYLEKKYNLPAGMFHTQGHGEDWNGLIKKVTSSEMEWKKDVLAIIKNNSGQARKEKLVAVHEGLPYRFLLLNFYPLLRRTEYTLKYSVKDFNLEEARAYMATKPHLLSLNEMYMVANSYPEGSEERNAVFRTAATIYPNDPVSMANLAVQKITEGSVDNATEKLLKGAANLKQAINSLGVLNAKKGNWQRAKELFMQVDDMPEAQNNIKEMEKMLESIGQ
uniref:DUF3868 domain-containing protein n=1 Tax=Prevotella sp. GTC17260 TaxID=3236796 RepID=A0AB33JFR2_9BACT